VKEKFLKTLSEYREMLHVMGDRSRSWCQKLKKPVCRRWRAWTPLAVIQQVGWRKPTRVSAGMVCQWHGWSMTTDILVHCHSKLGRSLQQSWTGCAPECKASEGWWACQ